MTTRIPFSNPTVQRAIRDLEELECIVAIDKAHLLLVLSGNKPSMHTGFYSEPVEIGHVMLSTDVDNINKLTDIITRLGLKYKIETKPFEEIVDIKHCSSELSLFCVAKEMSIVDRLIEARRNGDETAEGILLGFPKSAIAAYVGGTSIGLSHLPESTERVTANEMKFLNHMVSKDNWRDEVGYLPQYVRATKVISPKIYEQCLAE